MVASTWLFKILASYCNSKLARAMNCPVLRLLCHHWVPDKTGSLVINWWCRKAGLWHFLLLSLISLYLPQSVCWQSILSVPCPVHRLSSAPWAPLHFCPSVCEAHNGCPKNLGDSKKYPVAQGVNCYAGRSGWTNRVRTSACQRDISMSGKSFLDSTDHADWPPLTKRGVWSDPQFLGIPMVLFKHVLWNSFKSKVQHSVQTTCLTCCPTRC